MIYGPGEYKPFIETDLCRSDLTDDSHAAIRQSAVRGSRILPGGLKGRASQSITFLGAGYPKLVSSSAQDNE